MSFMSTIPITPVPVLTTPCRVNLVASCRCDERTGRPIMSWREASTEAAVVAATPWHGVVLARLYRAAAARGAT